MHRTVDFIDRWFGKPTSVIVLLETKHQIPLPTCVRGCHKIQDNKRSIAMFNQRVESKTEVRNICLFSGDGIKSYDFEGRSRLSLYAKQVEFRTQTSSCRVCVASGRQHVSNGGYRRRQLGVRLR